MKLTKEIFDILEGKALNHFEKIRVVNSKVTVVHILLCTTTSIGPAYAINLKYITPKKPHQKDPRLVSIIPLLKLFMINIY